MWFLGAINKLILVTAKNVFLSESAINSFYENRAKLSCATYNI